MRRLVFMTFLLLTMMLQNCDNNVTISDQGSRYIPNVHLTPLTPADNLPVSIKALLTSENLMDKNPIKFPLAYYLIQAEDIKVFYSQNFDKSVVSQLYLEISGVRYYKLFVHPDVDYSYSFLKHAYRYIGPDYTEFYATPTSSKKTMVVWSKEGANREPFVVRTEIDERIIPIEERMPASSAISSGPESIRMLFHRPIRGSKEPIEGQQITIVPEVTPTN